MKKAQCKKCKNTFHEREIYTIQQFQYRKIPSYKWSLEFFKKVELMSGIHSVKTVYYLLQMSLSIPGTNQKIPKFKLFI